MIKNLFPSDNNNNNIILIDKEFSCLEYNEFVKKFNFLICSRFHGLVHAYKNIVPCIALGWAVKYRELAENLGQQNYIFDITDERTSDSEIITAIWRKCAFANITLTTYIIAAIGTLIVTIVVSKFLARKVRKIDMVTSLKGNE